VNPTVSEIFNAAGLAWRDTRHVFDAIFNKVVIAFTITIITSALYMTPALMPRGTSSFLLVMLVILTTAVQAFLITPYFIAVHRFIILGEVTTNYLLTPGEPRFLRFFGWLLVFFALTFVAFLLPLALPISTVFRLAIQAVLVIVAIVVGLRVIILLPAVAVDAPGASWSGAMADTRGYSWRILFIVLLATLPLVFVRVIVGRTLGDLGGIAAISVPIFNGAMRAIGYTLGIVIASRLYERLGDRVKQPL